jgi:3-dehydroquinate synthase
MAEIRVKPRRSAQEYSVEVGHGLLHRVGDRIADGRVLVVSDPKVFGLYGESLVRVLGRTASSLVLPGGERRKNIAAAQRVVRCLGLNGFSRSDTIVSLGGGVIGDITGFAASIYHRGLRFVNIPTTLLAMIDASVGGKTGVNSEFGKNTIGAFYQPEAVIVDTDLLATLPLREIRCGLYEAVKHAVLAGGRLFEETSRSLNKLAGVTRYDSTFWAGTAPFIGRQIGFKARVIGGDPLELTGDVSPRSRKILNLGHTLAHAIEAATDHRGIRHGEAVGYGLLFAGALSKNLGLLPQNELDLLNDVVHRVGPLPTLNIDRGRIAERLKLDKKRSLGHIQWVLLEGIGRPVILPETQIPPASLNAAFRTLTRPSRS